METRNELHPHVSVMLNTKVHMFGPGNYRLLCYIEETGSLQQACLKMNLSYSKGSKMIRTVEKQLGYPLVERWSGGKAGGGSRLSKQGQQFLKQYQILLNRVQEYTNEQFKQIFQNEVV